MSQQQGPQILQRRAGNKIVEICSECGNIVQKEYSYQAPDNQIYKKRSCQSCGVVFYMEGTFRSHMEANPKEFR